MGIGEFRTPTNWLHPAPFLCCPHLEYFVIWTSQRVCGWVVGESLEGVETKTESYRNGINNEISSFTNEENSQISLRDKQTSPLGEMIWPVGCHFLVVHKNSPGWFCLSLSGSRKEVDNPGKGSLFLFTALSPREAWPQGKVFPFFRFQAWTLMHLIVLNLT